MDSILTSIKKMLGIAESYEHFDPELIMHINSVFSILTQLGVGPEEGFSITGKDEIWSDYLGDKTKLEMVKTYIYLKVSPMFDQTKTGAVLESINNMTKEIEWRLNVAVDPEE